MLYFNTLPKILTSDENGNLIILTNILTRAKLLDELQNNPMLFYTYAIQDGDTPEIVASKYYDDPNRFWLVTYSNQILDPVWDWPMTYQQLLEYIDNKYADEAAGAGKTPYEYAITTVYSYEKITSMTNNYTQTTTTNTTSLDATSYNSLTPSTNTYTLPDETTCTIQISKNISTLFDYEYNLNESKRNIKVLNVSYADQMEQTFQDLMSR